MSSETDPPNFEFVAVLGTTPPDRSELMARLTAGGAVAVLTWAELSTGGYSDDTIAVLFDQDGLVQEADLPAVLSTLAAAAAAAAAAATATATATAVVTARPVTDTLKLVNGQGALTGTADREDHRFVRAPIATRLGGLRAVAADLSTPSPIEALRALSANGATIISAA